MDLVDVARVHGDSAGYVASCEVSLYISLC